MTALQPIAADPELRRTGIGGSDAAAIAGFDNYRSALAVYYEKTGEYYEDSAGEAAQWGQLLEGPVADEFARRHNVDVVTAPPFVRHPEHEFMFANVDRDIVQEPDAILEVKTAGYWMSANWEDGVPERAQVQVQHYLAVREKTRAHVAVLLGGQRYADFILERDDRVINALLRMELDFWERVQERRPPPADGSASSKAALDGVWSPLSEGKAIVLPPDAGEWFARRAVAHEAEKAAKAAKAECDNLIRQALEDGEQGWLDGQLVCTLKEIPESPVKATVRRAYKKLHVKAAAS